MRRVARYWPLVYSKLLCLEWAWCPDVPYGATDGLRLLLNEEGVGAMAEESRAKLGDPVGYVAFLLTHEGVHAILNHGSRLSRFLDREVANVAADYKVNEMILHRNKEIRAEHVLTSDPFPLPEWVLLDLDLSGARNTEQLYQHLRKNEINQPPPPPTPPEDTPGEPADMDPLPGGGGGDDGQEDPDGQPDSSCGGDGAGGDDGLQSTEPGAQSPAQDNGTPAQRGGSGPPVPPSSGGDDRPGAGGIDTFPPVARAGEDQSSVETALEELNERLMVQDALESSTCGRGKGSNTRIVGERGSSTPQDWVSYAQQFVETRTPDGWMAPYNHGVYVATGMCAPGREGKKVGDIICVADSSGSIGPTAWKRFFELTQYLLDEVRPDRLLLVSCSDDVKDHVVLELGDTVPTKLSGGGGTSFKEAFDWVADDPHDLCIEPLLLIYFTDGVAYDHQDMDEPPYPVLWLSYQKPKSHFPWGEYAHITIE